jgi:hypothetical protein
VLDEPVYIRSPEYRYCLRSEPYYGWFTGVISGNRQLLLVAGAALEFDRVGQLLSIQDNGGGLVYPVPRSLFPTAIQDRGCPDVEAAWISKLAFEECPLFVRRFWLSDQWLGISDLPRGLRDFYRDPASRPVIERKELLADVAVWVESGMFAFNCGHGETYIGRDGNCLASPG